MDNRIKILIAFYFVMTLVTFMTYAIDKAKAKAHKWRIPEATLIGLAFLGGFLGAILGMKICHHKTKKPKFLISIPIASILNVGLIVWLCNLFM